MDEEKSAFVPVINKKENNVNSDDLFQAASDAAVHDWMDCEWKCKCICSFEFFPAVDG